MIARAALRAVSTKRLAYTATSARRFTHSRTASMSRSTRNVGWIVGGTALMGFFGWTTAARDGIRMEGSDEAANDTPEIIQAKSMEFAAEASAGLQSTPSIASTEDADTPKEGAKTEEEDLGSAAFNPETGEINWDCPCLGGMAHGPCGPQFREAFSCFIYSEQEPKGVDCIEKFKAMQDCFRAHPDVYGEELDDDEKAASGASGASELASEPESEPEPEPEVPKRKWRSRYED